MCEVMGIVNVTPDSFSDGGRYFEPEEALRRAAKLAAEGAAIVDFGGESTRPGATPLAWDEEWARLEPVLAAFAGGTARRGALVSVDTYHPETAERAVAAGADIVNCVYAGPVPDMLRIIARAARPVEIVLPADALPALEAASVRPGFYIDPMIGFGTTREQDVALLRSIPDLAKKGRVLVGASRKRIVKRLTGGKVAGKDLAGNLAIAVWAAVNGASVVRVHDVGETVQALKVANALIAR